MLNKVPAFVLVMPNVSIKFFHCPTAFYSESIRIQQNTVKLQTYWLSTTRTLYPSLRVTPWPCLSATRRPLTATERDPSPPAERRAKVWPLTPSDSTASLEQVSAWCETVRVCVSVNKRKVRGHGSMSHVDLLKTGEMNVELVWIIRSLFENILFQGHFGSEFSTFQIFGTLFFRKLS